MRTEVEVTRTLVKRSDATYAAVTVDVGAAWAPQAAAPAVGAVAHIGVILGAGHFTSWLCRVVLGLCPDTHQVCGTHTRELCLQDHHEMIDGHGAQKA